MSFNVTHAVMLGVAALGGFAVYKLSQTTGESEPDVETRDAAPQALTDPKLAMLGDPLHLTVNRYYRGRLLLPMVGAAPFTQGASLASLQQALTALGFKGVKVYDRVPAGWPASMTARITDGTRFFEGTWPLPTTDVPRPAHIEAMWIAVPPRTVTAGAAG
jgi:hypothetical protein